MEYLDSFVTFSAYLACQILYKDNPMVAFNRLKETHEYLKDSSIKVGNFVEINGALVPKAFCIVLIQTLHANYCFVAFRGSQFSSDWWNANFDVQLSVTEIGLLHKGFKERASCVPLQFIYELAIKKSYKIVFTGHSLGGAAAQICAREFISLLESSAHSNSDLIQSQFLCLTFASPLVGNDAWRKSIEDGYNGTLKMKFIHIVHKEDIIPRIISLLWGVLCKAISFSVNVITDLFVDWFSGSKKLFGKLLEYLGDDNILLMESKSVSTDMVSLFKAIGDEFTKLVNGLLEFKPVGTFIQVGDSEAEVIDMVVSIRQFRILIAEAVNYLHAHSLNCYFGAMQSILVPLPEPSPIPVPTFELNDPVVDFVLVSQSPIHDSVNFLKVDFIGTNLLISKKLYVLGTDALRHIYGYDISYDNLSSASITIITAPSSTVVQFESADVRLVTAFGNSYLFRNVPFKWNISSNHNVLWAMCPTNIFCMASILPVLCYDDILFHSADIQRAFRCVCEITKAAPLESILFRLAIGDDLSQFSIAHAAKIPFGSFKSECGYLLLKSALIQMQKCNMEELTISKMSYLINTLLEVAISMGKVSNDKVHLMSEYEKFYLLYELFNQSAFDDYGLLEYISNLLNGTASRDEMNKNKEAALFFIASASVKFTVEIDAFLHDKDKISQYSGETLESMIKPTLSLCEVIKRTRAEIIEMKDVVSNRRKELIENIAKTNDINENNRLQALARDLINNVQLKIAHKLDYVRFATLVAVDFISPIESTLLTMNENAIEMLQNIQNIHHVNDSWGTWFNGSVNWLGKIIKRQFTFRATAEEGFLLYQNTLRAYYGIGINEVISLLSYNRSVHYLYKKITGIDMIDANEDSFVPERELVISEYFSCKQVSFMSDPVYITKHWEYYFDPSISFTSTLKSIDARFMSILCSDRFGLACRLKIVLITCELRRILASLNIIGFFGESGAGKSSIISQLGISNVRSGVGADDRTVFPGLYRYPKRSDVLILDTVGFQLSINIINENPRGEISAITEVMRLNNILMDICSTRIIVVSCRIEVTSILDLVNYTADKSNCKELQESGIWHLTCFNKIDVAISDIVAYNRRQNPPVLQRMQQILEGLEYSNNYQLNPQLMLKKEDDKVCQFPRWVCYLRNNADIDSGYDDEMGSWDVIDDDKIKKMGNCKVRMLNDLKEWLDIAANRFFSAVKEIKTVGAVTFSVNAVEVIYLINNIVFML